jgi:hypothetical protein
MELGTRRIQPNVRPKKTASPRNPTNLTIDIERPEKAPVLSRADSGHRQSLCKSPSKPEVYSIKNKINQAIANPKFFSPSFLIFDLGAKALFASELPISRMWSVFSSLSSICNCPFLARTEQITIWIGEVPTRSGFPEGGNANLVLSVNVGIL